MHLLDYKFVKLIYYKYNIINYVIFIVIVHIIHSFNNNYVILDKQLHKLKTLLGAQTKYNQLVFLYNTVNIQANHSIFSVLHILYCIVAMIAVVNFVVRVVVRKTDFWEFKEELSGETTQYN